MAHYAMIDRVTNIVIGVWVGKNEGDNGVANWEPYYSNKWSPNYAKRVSYNTIGGVYFDPLTNKPSANQSKAFRKNYPGPGYLYDAARDAFIPPKPFPSWSLDEATCTWSAPTPYPADGRHYVWDEPALKWVIG